MVLTVEQLRGIPVRSPSLGTLKLKKVLVDYQKLQVVALVLGRTGLLGRPLTVPIAQIEVSESEVKVDQGAESTKETRSQFTDERRFGDIDERAVYTERKRHLGKLATYKIDTDTGTILAFWVRPPLALRGLWRQILLISRSQIVRITPEAIIVDDAIIKSALKPATAAELGGAGEPDAAFGAASTAE